MALDPKNFILGSHLVDHSRFSSVIDTAACHVNVSPYSGISLAVEASGALRNMLNPSATSLGLNIVPRAYPITAYASLATLTKPYEAFTPLTITNPYRSTLDSLAVAGNVGRGLHDLYVNTTMFPSALVSSAPSLTNAAHLAGVSDSLSMASRVAAPYIASASAVFLLETSYARVLGNTVISMAGATTVTTQLAAVNGFKSNILGVSEALRDAWSTIRTDSTFLSTASLSVLRQPAIELYAAAQAAASISLPIVDRPTTDDDVEKILNEAVDSFESRLAALHQGLVTTYRGGSEALESKRADWQRHAMVSFRELSTHVLHQLAPDIAILPTASGSDLHGGRPTRRARLNFIFADAGGVAMAKFYEADMKAALELFDLLNDGTHRLDQHATPEQVHYLRGRIVGLISSMLEARGF